MTPAKISEAAWKDRSPCRTTVTTAGYAGQCCGMADSAGPEDSIGRIVWVQ